MQRYCNCKRLTYVCVLNKQRIYLHTYHRHYYYYAAAAVAQWVMHV